LNQIGLDTEESGLGLASWFKAPRRVMASAANLFTLEEIAEHHGNEEHMSDIGEQNDDNDVFSNDETESEAGKYTLHVLMCCCDTFYGCCLEVVFILKSLCRKFVTRGARYYNF